MVAVSAVCLLTLQSELLQTKTGEYKDDVDIGKIKALLGCSGKGSSNLSACVDAFSEFADKNAVDERLQQDLRNALLKEHKTFKATRDEATASIHPSLIPLNPEYAPRSEWKQHAYPDLNIIGIAKAGTSQLYKILSTHPDAVPFSKQKESCVLANRVWNEGKNKNAVQGKLFDYFNEVHSLNEESLNSSKITVDACIETEAAIIRAQYFQPENHPKYIILLRDPADWLWAAWNFWAQPNIDKDAGPGGSWTQIAKHYRSPELFHEIMASGYKSPQGFGLLQNPNPPISRVLAVLGEENVMFARSEDMKPDVVGLPGGFLDKLSNFTGLDRTKFVKSLTEVILNCNDKKGAQSDCGSKSVSSYEIAGGREMLAKTRTLVYLRLWERCMMWVKEIGIVYERCIGVING